MHGITKDTWMAFGQCSYMGVTVHWLDDNFGTNNKCPAVRLAPDIHTADFITCYSATVTHKCVGIMNG